MGIDPNKPHKLGGTASFTGISFFSKNQTPKPVNVHRDDNQILGFESGVESNKTSCVPDLNLDLTLSTPTSTLVEEAATKTITKVPGLHGSSMKIANYIKV